MKLFASCLLISGIALVSAIDYRREFCHEAQRICQEKKSRDQNITEYLKKAIKCIDTGKCRKIEKYLYDGLRRISNSSNEVACYDVMRKCEMNLLQKSCFRFRVVGNEEIRPVLNETLNWMIADGLDKSPDYNSMYHTFQGYLHRSLSNSEIKALLKHQCLNMFCYDYSESTIKFYFLAEIESYLKWSKETKRNLLPPAYQEAMLGLLNPENPNVASAFSYLMEVRKLFCSFP